MSLISIGNVHVYEIVCAELNSHVVASCIVYICRRPMLNLSSKLIQLTDRVESRDFILQWWRGDPALYDLSQEEPKSYWSVGSIHS